MKKYVKTLIEGAKDFGPFRVRYPNCGVLVHNKLTGKHLSIRGDNWTELWYYGEPVMVADNTYKRFWTCGTGTKSLQAFLKDCVEYYEELDYECMDNDPANWTREYDPKNVVPKLKGL